VPELNGYVGGTTYTAITAPDGRGGDGPRAATTEEGWSERTRKEEFLEATHRGRFEEDRLSAAKLASSHDLLSTEAPSGLTPRSRNPR
jgi:hypothetical protein